MYEEPSIWETQPVQRGVVMRNASTGNNAKDYTKRVQKLSTYTPSKMHTQLNGRVHVHVV